ncbi:MAG: J domain-containing protein [Desulfuromonadales bacterium]|nr:J domain-containing protein [Desulfuromonadales bacterium]MBN2792721.1 J domain-containing protein [Desulfuromonadales bacterium]
MLQVTEAEVYRACRTLFGPELQLTREFLTYLQPSGVRSAYRKKAKVIHPDCFAVSCTTTKSRQKRLFQDLNQAHQTVQSYLKQKHQIQGSSYQPKRSAYSQSSRQRQDAPRQSQGPRFWLPQRPLQFGTFLYYLGIVPFQALITALSWQRQQRPTVGDIARRWGWLSDQDIRQVITSRTGVFKFGERAEQLGLLSSLQVRTLLFHQRSKQKQIGDYFIAQGFIDAHQRDELLKRLAEHNRTYRNGFSQHYYYFHR